MELKNNRKNYKRIQDTAAMLNAYKDELDNLSSSLPRETMSWLTQMVPYLTKENITFDSHIIPEIQSFSKEESVRAERKERKQEINKRRERLNLSDEQRSLHFKRKQKEYDVEVNEILMGLDEWYDDFMTFERRTPNEQDFATKLHEVKNDLKELDSRINPDYFFEDGPDDIALCGRILVKNEINWDEEEELEAVCLMSALQWLVEKPQLFDPRWQSFIDPL